MSKGISVGTLLANGDLDIQVEGMWGSRWSLLCEGDFGSGTLTPKGGDGADYADIMVTSTAAGTTHNDIPITLVGMYTFNACCTHLRFTLASSTDPDLDLTLFPEQRP